MTMLLELECYRVAEQPPYYCYYLGAIAIERSWWLLWWWWVVVVVAAAIVSA